MAKISTAGIEPQRKLFHNEWINVYPTHLPLSKISFWRENNRTVFTFERLSREKGKKISDIDLEDITRFVAGQDIHKLEILSDSIGRNGIQVPLIIRDDGKLLDGNRRFFACHWLAMRQKEKGLKLPESLSRIPVNVIRQTDLSATLELKILAEANFIPDLKVAWPLDAQARAVDDYVSQIQKEKKLDFESAVAEAVGVFGISRSRVTDLLDTLKLTKQFIADAHGKDEQMRRREIVEEKFVYLWEFRNKAMKGSGALGAGDLPEVRDLFFSFMAKGRDNPIKNVKQIEPIVQARRDDTVWKILKDSKGAKLAVVVSAMNDKKEVRRAEDRIRIFLSWLKEQESGALSSRTKSLLKEIAQVAAKKAGA